MDSSSMVLFARPSFVEGFARVMDIACTLNEYNTALDGEQADELAFLADCIALSEDVGMVKAETAKKGSTVE